MPVAARYINRELLLVFVVTLLVVTVIAVGGRFIGYLQDAAVGKYAAESLLTLLLLRLPEFMQLLLPFSFFVGVLLTLGRLHAEQEMVVLVGGGASTLTVLRWLSPAIALMVLAVGCLSLWLTPKSDRDLYHFLEEAHATENFARLNPGVFHTYARGERVTYNEGLDEDQKVLQRVFIAEQRPEQPGVTVWAEEGTQVLDPNTASRFLLLEQGVRYEGVPGEAGYRVVEFGQMGQRVDTEGDRIRILTETGFATQDLLAQPTPEAQRELHWRLALPLFTGLASLLGVGFARVRPRQGRFSRLLPGLGVFLAYYLLLLVNQNLLERGQLAIGFGYWIVHALFLGVALWAVRRVDQPTRT